MDSTRRALSEMGLIYAQAALEKGNDVTLLGQVTANVDSNNKNTTKIANKAKNIKAVTIKNVTINQE